GRGRRAVSRCRVLPAIREPASPPASPPARSCRRETPTVPPASCLPAAAPEGCDYRHRPARRPQRARWVDRSLLPHMVVVAVDFTKPQCVVKSERGSVGGFHL